MPRKVAKSVSFTCLRSDAHFRAPDGDTITKPMLVGFASAAVLDKIAKAPAFAEDEADLVIAERLQHPPVAKWQRPLDSKRVAEMRNFFSADAHLMPNPVLLAANPERKCVQVDHDKGVYLVTISPERPDAVWILDGQHRIAALAASKQHDNPIPFVLLHDDGDAYERREFAELFAEVTTAAVALQEPHKSWLEYAFELGKAYVGPRSDAHKRAFATVIDLGSTQFVEPGHKRNYFAGSIRFNPHTKLSDLGVGGVKGAFVFSAEDFADIVYRHYFHYPAANGPADPSDVAHQLSLAFSALRELLPKAAAFFQPGNLYVQEGFLVGVLTYLRKHGPPIKWTDILRKTTIATADWVFPVGLKTGGQEGNHSRKAANASFAEVFGQGHVPAGVTDLASYLLGNSGTRVKLIFTDQKTGVESEYDIPAGVEVMPIRGQLRPNMTLRVECSPNVGYLGLEANTRGSAYAREISRLSKKGFPLDLLVEDAAKRGPADPVTLTVNYEHYGGFAKKKRVELKD